MIFSHKNYTIVPYFYQKVEYNYLMKLHKKALLITTDNGFKETEALKLSLEGKNREEYSVETLKTPSLEELKNGIEHFFTEHSRSSTQRLIYITGEGVEDCLAFIRIFQPAAKTEQFILIIDSPADHSFTPDGENTALIGGRDFTGTLIKGLNSGKADFDRDGLIDINDLFIFIYKNSSSCGKDFKLSRKINSSGIIPVRQIERRETAPPELDEGWGGIKENETHSFFVLYLELDFDIEKYRIDELWDEHIEEYLFDPELGKEMVWQKFLGNEVSKKRIYIAPVLNENLSIVKSIFRIFLNKQIDDIRINKKEIKTRYYFTTLDLPYKILDSSERLIPSCSNVYKLSENLDFDKLYFSEDVIDLLPINMKKNLQQISQGSDLFIYTFNLLT